MKESIIFIVLFVVFTTLTLIYANKSVEIYNGDEIKRVEYAPGEFQHKTFTKTYHDNYASGDGAIGFAILGAASLLAFAYSVQSEKKLVREQVK